MAAWRMSMLARETLHPCGALLSNKGSSKYGLIPARCCRGSNAEAAAAALDASARLSRAEVSAILLDRDKENNPLLRRRAALFSSVALVTLVLCHGNVESMHCLSVCLESEHGHDDGGAGNQGTLKLLA